MDELFREMILLLQELEYQGIRLPDSVQVIHVLFATGATLVVVILLLMISRQKRLSAEQPVSPSIVEPSAPASPEPAGDTVSDQNNVAASEVVAALEVNVQPTDLLARLTDVENNDPGLKDELTAARQLLDDGNMETAVEALSRIGEMEHDAGRVLRQQAEDRLSGAATIHLVSGDLRLSTGDLEGATAEYAQAIETVPRGHDALLAECLNKHGAAAYNTGQLDVAAGSFKRASRVLERIRGLDHPDVATATSNLAMLHYARGDLAAAEPLYRRALKIDEAALGESSHEVATDLNNMGLLFKKQGRLEEAEPLFERALKIKESQLDPGHPSLVTGLRNYAGLLRDMGRIEEAETYEARAES